MRFVVLAEIFRAERVLLYDGGVRNSSSESGITSSSSAGSVFCGGDVALRAGLVSPELAGAFKGVVALRGLWLALMIGRLFWGDGSRISWLRTLLEGDSRTSLFSSLIGGMTVGGGLANPSRVRRLRVLSDPFFRRADRVGLGGGGSVPRSS